MLRPVIGQARRGHPFRVVSRRVLREAVKMLTVKGLLSARPRQRTRMDNFPDVLRWTVERRFSSSCSFNSRRRGSSNRPARSPSRERRATPSHCGGTAAPGRIGARDNYARWNPTWSPRNHYAAGSPFFPQLHEQIAAALRYSIRRTNVHRDMIP